MNIWLTRPEPETDALALVSRADATTQGVWLTGNPLADGWTPGADAGGTLVMYSGSLASEPFASHPANWLRPGRAALDAVVARTASTRATGRLCLHPHCRHVLSDLPSCRAFRSDHPSEAIGVGLAPASMLEPSMLDDLDEHLDRLFAPGPDAWSIVFLSDISRSDAGGVATGPLGSGLLPRDTVRRYLEPFASAGTPIVIGGAEVDRQIEWIEGVGGL